ncbi:hypothetical protein HELRODRAFT_190944 [Helobdella robusta]|uniref:Uncharacterized protein n=1 Tax=Helobdella robusta TaxID=6412 RepID=T1FSG1_HELRO|nr:hypothetical protein HELRODRAFT_190944 [Helobdella robusta]ESO08217.1 hypothetical protein HELRODRAFT_190944 [Helobdella robusta]
MHTLPECLLVKADGSVTLKQLANEGGSYEMTMSLNDCQVEGSPIKVNVCPLDEDQKEILTVFGQGVSSALCGKTQEFFITLPFSCSPDQLNINMDGPSAVDIRARALETQDRVLRVEYVAFCPGEYSLCVTYKKEHVLGSPFTVKVAGEGRKKSYLTIHASSEYDLNVEAKDLKDISAVLTSPDNSNEQCQLTILENGNLALATFQPKAIGTYQVHVQQNSAPHPSSPISIKISEVGHANKVKVQGRLRQGQAGVWNDIKIDCSNAGYGELYLSIEGSHCTEFRSKSDSPKNHLIEYKPHEPGAYQMYILFNDEPVPGTPFLLEIGGQSSGKLRTVIQKHVSMSDVVQTGHDASLMLALPGLNSLEMEANIQSPGGLNELCEIRDHPNSMHEIKFKCLEVGLNVINIKKHGIHVPGSPVQYTVGKLPTLGLHKVHCSGLTLQRGVTQKRNYFNIYVHEAGPGLLSVAMDGPSKPELNLTNTGSGFVIGWYSVSKPGEYGLGIKFDNFHVCSSPMKIVVDDECKEAKLVTVHAMRDRGVEVERAATFEVHTNGAPGSLIIKTLSPSGIRGDVLMQSAEKDIYSCSFVPKENGVYYVEITLNGTHVTGSPFAVLVGKLGAEPSLVTTRGKGLEKGEVGKQCNFDVVTVNCGSGKLLVSIEGPAKVPINCTEIEDGYEYSYTPRYQGNYVISIKFCHVSIPGSPFLVNVTGHARSKKPDTVEISNIVIDTVEKKPGSKSRAFQGDASKVIAEGVGLKKGFVGRTANFKLDVKEAGQGLLGVSIMSSSGKPVRELNVKKQKPGLFQGTFVADEKGDHVMNVRWGKEDIPGSPFYIIVA